MAGGHRPVLHGHTIAPRDECADAAWAIRSTNRGVLTPRMFPLRELVPWKEAESYWDDLMDGKYEWSSIGKQLREKGIVPC